MLYFLGSERDFSFFFVIGIFRLSFGKFSRLCVISKFDVGEGFSYFVEFLLMLLPKMSDVSLNECYIFFSPEEKAAKHRSLEQQMEKDKASCSAQQLLKNHLQTLNHTE